jgi:predicted enzyme related to lactoylglutathione lyase
MLKRVHSAFYWTKDMDEAVAFYRDVLGLDLTARFGEDWSEFDVGGSRVALHGSRGMAPPNEGATVVFEVDDLDATMRALQGRGVRFEGEVTEVPESGRFVSLRDPAGNLVQMFEPSSEAHH